MAHDLHLLETIQVLTNVLQAETTTVTDVAIITQGVWNASEERQIKKQLLGLLKQIPTPEYFEIKKDDEAS